MKHRTSCPCSTHRQPFESGLAQATIIASLVILATCLAVIAIAMLRSI